MTPKAGAKIGKLDFIKLKFCCASNDPIKKVKNTLEWEKKISNHGDNQFVSGLYKKFVILIKDNSI